MIVFEDVSKNYAQRHEDEAVLRRVTHRFMPGDQTAVLGLNGAGKSTLLRLLSGAESADSGTIRRHGRVSWPLGFRGGLHGAMSGRENVAFIARIYGQNLGRMLDFVEDFAELGEYMFEETRTYSTGMKARLSFGISMAMEFDYYLVDEVIAVGDRPFRLKCYALLREKLKTSTLIYVSHNNRMLRYFCNKGIVLKDGRLHDFDDLEEAIKFYETTFE